MSQFEVSTMKNVYAAKHIVDPVVTILGMMVENRIVTIIFTFPNNLDWKEKL